MAEIPTGVVEYLYHGLNNTLTIFTRHLRAHVEGKKKQRFLFLAVDLLFENTVFYDEGAWKAKPLFVGVRDDTSCQTTVNEGNIGSFVFADYVEQFLIKTEERSI